MTIRSPASTPPGASIVSPTLSAPTITGQAGFADGTAAAPSITFTSDTDTGAYRASANRGGLSGLGLAVLEWLGVASAVNFLLATNSVTLRAPSVAAVGSDTDISLLVSAKGAGGVSSNGRWVFPLAVTAKTTSATLTGAQIMGGIITASQGAAGAAVYTLPIGTDLQTALPADFGTDHTFDFSLVNISTNIAETAAIAGDTGTTLVGGGTALANSAAGLVNAATFRVRKTGNNAFSIYHIG